MDRRKIVHPHKQYGQKTQMKPP